MDGPQLADESRVLIIYTGGTIGMLVGQQGYVPEPYYLTETLRSQNRFHDPLQDSLFSNAGTVQGFREWSGGSGRSSPAPSQNTAPQGTRSTLLVRSTRPIGDASLILPKDNIFRNRPRCIRVADNVYEAHLPSLVTPRSKVPGGTATKSIRYAILEWNPLLDSSNIDIQDWIRLATEIELNYSFDAFVVLHGTDTMSYTSSALSFLLEDLGKTVVITGAQIPMSQLRNDAVDNLMGALTIAGHFIIPECCLYFNHTLYRGNRATKMSSYDLAAFESPNFDPLVKGGPYGLHSRRDSSHQANKSASILTSTGTMSFAKLACGNSELTKETDMSPHVATLRLFPGIAGATIRAFCSSPIRGVVLETFGAGNAPQRPDLIEALKEACDRGVVVVAISQCVKGSVSDAYETARTLRQVGVVPGSDMTPECALTKLSYLLSKSDLTLDQVRDLVGVPLRGELTSHSVSVPGHDTKDTSTDILDTNKETIHNVLSQFVRLSRPLSLVPGVKISPDALATATEAQNTAAPWTWTVAEAYTTEYVLLPFLVHLAAAKNDPESLQYCIDIERQASTNPAESPRIGITRSGNIAGGIINCLDAGSGRSPLHVAALNGHEQVVTLLLQSGALVHMRDTLGHTAIYYAARHGHLDVVGVLVQAGAILGGFDTDFAKLGFEHARRMGDETMLKIWARAGVKIPTDEGE